ncbi:MAG: DUF4160 domain-containing protein [Bacteriovoracaceae bacterium]|nr:DUF4160 domain-containing protein [Bacteriovoracaceae bacterium]
MPTISIFYGIKILMFFDEHNPPHFHAQYAEFHAIILINENCVLEGYLPSRQLKLVLAWAEIHKDELLNNWLSAQSIGKIKKIAPLK